MHTHASIRSCVFLDPVAEDQWNTSGHCCDEPGKLQHHGHRHTVRRQHSSTKGAYWIQSIEDIISFLERIATAARECDC